MAFSNLPEPYTRAELSELRKTLTGLIGGESGAAAKGFSTEEFVSAFNANRRPRYYGEISPEHAESIGRISGASPVAGAACLKLALVLEMLAMATEDRLSRCVPSIQDQYRIHLRLIRHAIETRPDSWFRIDNDVYMKDLALCSGRMLPGGVYLFEAFGGVPRSLLWRGGLRCAGAFAAFMIELGATSPLFTTHADSRRMSEFTAAGFHRFYLRVAEQLSRQPEIRGLAGVSWLYDPAVPRLTPKLAFLHEVPLGAGARLFRYDLAGESGRADALSRSPDRRLAFERGEYIPTSYALIWTRKDILRWADRNGAEIGPDR